MVDKRDPGSAGMLEEAIDQTLVCTFNDLDNVEQTIKQNAGEVAAIILEPIPHNVGCLMPKPGFLEGLRQLATDNGIILVFDEVITGFRHDLGGYQKICGVTPDLTAMGKSMANGFPVAAIAGKAELMDRFATQAGGDVFYSGTYNGHPVTMAAALAVIETLEDEPVHEHIFRLGEKARQGMREITERLGIPAIVAGFGSVFVTYFMTGKIETYTDLLRNDADLFVRFRRGLIDRGIFCLPNNIKRNHVSYAHTDADIDFTLQACEDTLKELVK
jgi:glutamate-1-semialdehyde 2,1-aminomutase